jgi:hypothetical protein
MWKAVESLLATKHQIQEHMPCIEEIEAFLDGKMRNLAEVIAGDPFRAKQEIQRRVKELRLRPIKTTDGLSFEVTGDVGLFAPEDGVMLGSSSSQSSQHYTSCHLPLCTIIYQ